MVEPSLSVGILLVDGQERWYSRMDTPFSVEPVSTTLTFGANLPEKSGVSVSSWVGHLSARRRLTNDDSEYHGAKDEDG